MNLVLLLLHLRFLELVILIGLFLWMVGRCEPSRFRNVWLCVSGVIIFLNIFALTITGYFGAMFL